MMYTLKLWWCEWWPAVAVCAGLIGLVGGVVVFESVHPCVKRGPPQTCFHMICNTVGYSTTCMPLPFDCTACLERSP